MYESLFYTVPDQGEKKLPARSQHVDDQRWCEALPRVTA
jgi:hypothetical protein